MPHLGVLESNLSGSGFEGLRVAKELGCRVTFFTSGMERYLAVAGAAAYFDKYVDEIAYCDTADDVALAQEVKRIDAERELTGFLTMAEYEVVSAAKVAAELGLPGPSVESVSAARNKLLTRRVCSAEGVPVPAFRGVRSAEEARAAAVDIGLPCVVKPSDETSSADVRRCMSADDVATHAASILAKETNIRGQRRSPEALVEECLDGPEVSVEVIAVGDRLDVLGVTDKTLFGSSTYVEAGHVFPSLLPKELVSQCSAVATSALRAIGFRLGMAHVEVKFGGTEPKLVEINPRPAGDRIHELVNRSLRISCLRVVVQQYLGHLAEIPVPAVASRGAAIRFLRAPAGVVRSVQGVDAAAKMPDVQRVSMSVSSGTQVGRLLRNEDRVGYVLAESDTPYLALRRAEAAAWRIEVDVDESAAS